MKTIYYVVMISMLFLPRCSSVYLIDHTESCYISTHEELQGKEVLITLASDQIIKGRYLRITIDSTSWIDSHSQHRQTVSTSDVAEISISRHGVGSLQGLWLGISGDVCAGLLISKLTYHCNEIISDCDMKPLYRAGSALLGEVIGGLCGLSLGASAKASDRYVLTSTRDTANIRSLERVAQDAAEAWLILIDSANYLKAWNESDECFKQRLSRQSWEPKIRSFQITYGKIETRKFKSAEYDRILIDDAIIEKIVIEYESSFEKRKLP